MQMYCIETILYLTAQLYYQEENAEMETVFQCEFLEDQFFEYKYINSLPM